MSVQIKFCGLTRAADAAFADACGGDFVGVVFAGGPRTLDAHQAGCVLRASRRARRVGVIPAASDRLRDLVTGAGLDVVQLHGAPTAESVRAARTSGAREVWAVVATDGCRLSVAALDLFLEADAVVLDTKTASGLGGSGQQFDWASAAARLAAVERTAKLVVAGGLNSGNVAAAIAYLQPDIVDVSSGVESAPGIKDPELMIRFVEAVRSA